MMGEIFDTVFVVVTNKRICYVQCCNIVAWTSFGVMDHIHEKRI